MQGNICIYRHNQYFTVYQTLSIRLFVQIQRQGLFNTPTITRQHTARDCSCLLANLTFQSLQVIQKSNILAQRHIYQAHQHCESNNNYISNKFFHTELMNPAALPPCQNSTDTISDNPDTPTIITTSPQYRLPPVMVQQYSPLLPVALM